LTAAKAKKCEAALIDWGSHFPSAACSYSLPCFFGWKIVFPS